MQYFGSTNRGAIRKENQDSYSIKESDTFDGVFLAVCDGMGGANAGGFASRLAIKDFISELSCLTTDILSCDFFSHLKSACDKANSDLYACSSENPEFQGMGTTLVGGYVFTTGECYLINIGDSRAYLISRKRNSIIQITRDHSLVADWVEKGILTKEEAKNHKKRNIITRAIGTDCSTAGDCYHFKAEADDVLILCTDGLSGLISEMDMLSLSKKYISPEHFVNRLINDTLKLGAPDNVTVISVFF